MGGGKNIQFTRLARFPQYVGKRLSEAAQAEGISEVDFFIRIADDEVGIIGHTMSEPDLRAFYQQPWVMVASDGGVDNNHPRGAGTFPRVLGRLVREQQWLTLPEAIRKMTSLPAARLGLPDRGRIAPGAKADLVLFDPATISRSLDVRGALASCRRASAWCGSTACPSGETARPRRNAPAACSRDDGLVEGRARKVGPALRAGRSTAVPSSTLFG